MTFAASDVGWNRVWTMADWYDGPRGGIADHDGVPHLYESEWDDLASNYADTFRLSPVSPEVFALALEDWAIWQRFEAAHAEGKASLDDHPALPDDRARHEEILRSLDGKLATEPGTGLRVRAEWRAGEVRWFPVTEIEHP